MHACTRIGVENPSAYLLTIISSPSPVARQSEPATLVAIFSRGKVTIGKPAHRISVPVVCALHKGLNRVTKKNPNINMNTKTNSLEILEKKRK